MEERACVENAIVPSWRSFDSKGVGFVLLWAIEPSCSASAVGLGSCVQGGGLKGLWLRGQLPTQRG